MDKATEALMFARRAVANGTARGIREHNGLSRSEMARGAAVSVAAIRAWESGIRRPRGPEGTRYGALLQDLLDVGGMYGAVVVTDARGTRYVLRRPLISP